MPAEHTELGLPEGVEEALRRRGFRIVPVDDVRRLVDSSLATAQGAERLAERALWAERALRQIGRELHRTGRARWGRNWLWRTKRMLPRTMTYLQVLEDRDAAERGPGERRYRRRCHG